jgi:hypothetical protein
MIGGCGCDITKEMIFEDERFSSVDPSSWSVHLPEDRLSDGLLTSGFALPAAFQAGQVVERAAWVDWPEGLSERVMEDFVHGQVESLLRSLQVTIAG